VVIEINKAAYLATVYDGNLDPKCFKELKTVLISQNGGKLCVLCTEFTNMEHTQFWQITPNTSVPTGRKIIGSRWALAHKMMDIIKQDASQKVSVKYRENILKRTMLHITLTCGNYHIV
jgi:hypothetical protein